MLENQKQIISEESSQVGWKKSRNPKKTCLGEKKIPAYYESWVKKREVSANELIELVNKQFLTEMDFQANKNVTSFQYSSNSIHLTILTMSPLFISTLSTATPKV